MAAEKPAVENTPPVAPQASSADPSGTYEDRRGLGGRPGGRPRGAVGRRGARVAHTHWGLWLCGRPELVRVPGTESISGRPHSQFFRFLEPPTTGYVLPRHCDPIRPKLRPFARLRMMYRAAQCGPPLHPSLGALK